MIDLPEQEPFTPIGARYHAQVMARSAGIEGQELAYGANPYQRILIFNTARAEADTLLFFHGGGWTNGYKEWMAFMAPAVNAAGLHFVSAGYRLAPQHVFPTGLRDCEAALLHMPAPGRVFVGGHSAGGHYAAMLALGQHRARIAGCLPVSGVYDFGPESGLPSRPRFLGEAGEQAASPIQNIATPTPPFLLAWGERDFPHLIVQAQRFAAALELGGGVVSTIVLPEKDHLGASYDCADPDGTWLPTATAWMRAV